MKTGFIKSENYANLLETYARLEKRAARERCILLVTGEAGLGKTRAIDRLAVDKNALYVRASSVGRPLALMKSLVETAPQISTRGNAHAIQQEIIKYLAHANVPMIIDECQHLIRSDGVEMIECLRDISDRAEVPLILVAGELGVEAKLARHPQIASRIAETVEFKPFKLAEVGQIIQKLTDVQFDDALIVAVHQRTGGKMRLLLEGIQRLEDFAKANTLETVCLANVKANLDTLICRDWQARKPESRRAAA